jgi:hypothetical protein
MNRLSGSAKYTHSTFAERVGFLRRSPFGRTHGTFLCFAERVGFLRRSPFGRTHGTFLCFAERVGFLRRSPFGRTHGTFLCFAERVGFEPTVPLRIHYLSRVANSTTLASLRYFKYTESRIFFQWPGKYFKFPNLHGT